MRAQPGKALRLWDIIDVHESEEIDAGLYRVVYKVPRIDKIYLFRLVSSPDKTPPDSGVPIAFSLSAILDLLGSGAIGLGEIVLPWCMTLPEDKLSSSAKVVEKKHWNAIKPLVSKDRYAEVTTDAALRQRAFNKRAEELGKDKRDVSRLLVRYWFYGGGQRSVRPHFVSCGGRGKSRTSARKLGRPPRVVLTGHDETRLGVNVSDQDKKIIEDLTRSQIIALHWPINSTYNHFKDHYCADTTIDSTGHIITTPRDVNNVIQFNQFYYHHVKCRKRLEMQKLQAARDWDLKHRQLPSSAIHGVYGPCDRFEIDATVANAWLVSRYDRRLIIGRPIVYLVCDTWSRFIVGIHVALEGPKWSTARLALCNTFMNKVPFLKSLGFADADENTWPAHDFCSLLVSDRGEVLSKDAERALQDGLSIISAIACAGRGDMKAIVERRFGTLDTVLSWIPGAYRARALEALKASNYDPRKDARLTINDFLRILVEEILYFNNEQEYYGVMTPEMRNTGLSWPTPRNLFLWGMEHLTGREDPESSQVRTAEDIYRTLLPCKDCTVKRQGIQFRKGMHFTSQRLLDQEYFARRSKDKDDKNVIRLYYEPFNLDAYVLDETNRQWEQVFLREADKARYANLTENEIDDMLASEALDRSDHADAKNRRRYGKTRRQEGLIEDATRIQEEAAKSKGGGLDTKNIRDNRSIDAANESAKNAKAYANYGVPNSSTKVTPKKSNWPLTSTPRAEVVNLMDRLRKQR